MAWGCHRRQWFLVYSRQLVIDSKDVDHQASVERRKGLRGFRDSFIGDDENELRQAFGFDDCHLKRAISNTLFITVSLCVLKRIHWICHAPPGVYAVN